VNLPDLLPAEWREELAPFLDAEATAALGAFVAAEYAAHTIYPPIEDLFAAYRLCSPAETRVLILGQDPYHGPGQAHGLSFSVRDGVRIPPSLRNIFKELAEDAGVAPPSSGDLQEPTPEQTAIIADLHWLIHQGHVIEFANGRIETAKKPIPKPPRPAPKPALRPGSRTPRTGRAAARPVPASAGSAPSAPPSPAPWPGRRPGAARGFPVRRTGRHRSARR